MTLSKKPPPNSTCEYYLYIQEEACGKKADHQIKVNTAGGQMVVKLCDEHKSRHDRRQAENRKGERTPYLTKGGRVEEI